MISFYSQVFLGVRSCLGNCHGAASPGGRGSGLKAVVGGPGIRHPHRSLKMQVQLNKLLSDLSV